MKAMNLIKTTLVVLGLLTLGSTQFVSAKAIDIDKICICTGDNCCNEKKG